MSLEKAPSWTDLYYDVVGHYFWNPNLIGRIRDERIPARHWSEWKKRLMTLEAPVEHIMKFLFYVAPEDLLDRLVSTLLKRDISDLRLVAPGDDIIDGDIVQPDIIVRNESSLVFLELKVDSHSSIDQFTKYGIAAQCLMRAEPHLKTADLIILARHAEHGHVWSHATKLGLDSERAVRETALRGLEGDATVWSQRGVQRFMKTHPEQIGHLATRVKTIGLHLADYNALDKVLREYAAEERAVVRLINGLRGELKRRMLVSD
jgi:hypothetical protein